ncbi:MAG: stage II sporulation protein M [Nanoarchaeota archaeon]|nr:stage II sporulation protein M [Nanoarchaeota archaeon]
MNRLGIFFEKQYKKSFEYIQDSGKYIYWALVIFFIFTIIGLIFPIPERLFLVLIDYFKELILKTQNFSTFEMILFIFTNNSFATFFSIIFGIIFGIFPIINSVINGYVLGFAGSLSVSEFGILSLWKLLPHGILELTAVFISLGMGLRIGATSLKSVIKNKGDKKLTKELKDSLRVYFLVVLPLLLLAAIIEGILIGFSF